MIIWQIYFLFTQCKIWDHVLQILDKSLITIVRANFEFDFCPVFYISSWLAYYNVQGFDLKSSINVQSQQNVFLSFLVVVVLVSKFLCEREKRVTQLIILNKLRRVDKLNSCYECVKICSSTTLVPSHDHKRLLNI